jgi:tetratricopeptide (TPR) repeat protein
MNMRYRAVIFAAGIITLSFVMLSHGSPRSAACSSNEADFIMGNKYAKELVHDKAIEMFSKFIEANRDIQQSDQACRETAVLNLASAYYNRGNSHLFRLDTENAVADFTSAIALQQNMPQYYYYRALSLAKDRKAPPALRREKQMNDLAMATKLDPSYGLKGIFMLGHDLVTYRTVPEYPEEVDDVRVILDAGMNANQADAEGRTALMFSAAWGHAGVIKLLLARGADAGMTDKRGVSALVIAVAEDKEPAVILLEPFAKSERDYYTLAAYYLSRNNAGKALININAAVKINADNPDSRLLQGNIYMYLKDYDSAISTYQKTLLLSPGHKNALYKLSLCYSAKAAESAPEDYMMAANRATAHLKAGELENSIEMFGKALDILSKEMEREKNSRIYQSASWYSLFLTKFAEAERLAKEGLGADGKAYSLSSNLGHAYLLQGKNNEAMTEYRKYLEQDRSKSVALFIKALKDDMALLKLRYPEKRGLFEWAEGQLYLRN